MYAGISEESKLCFCKLIEKLQKHLSALHFSAFQGRKVNFSRYPPWGTERLYQSQVVCVCVSLFYVIDTGSMCLLFVNNFNIRFTRRLGIRYPGLFGIK